MNDTRKSMLDVAVEILTASSEPVAFPTLWAQIVETLGITKEEENERLPLFYTTISLDGRFVVLRDDLWDLKAKHAYDEVHRDVNDIYTTDEEDDDPEDTDEGEEAEKTAKKTKKGEDDDSGESEDDEDSEEKENREETY